MSIRIGVPAPKRPIGFGKDGEVLVFVRGSDIRKSRPLKKAALKSTRLKMFWATTYAAQKSPSTANLQITSV
jgi:hypothetical protein